MSALITGAEPLVQVDDLVVEFGVATRGWHRQTRTLRAVDGIDLVIERGETLALVGESGCGKSTLGRAIVRLQKPTRGAVRFESEDVWALRGASLRRWRSRAQIIFQDPYSSLNPRLTVGEIVGEPIRAQRSTSRSRRGALVADALARVGLPRDAARRYPHAFSGGQRQRIGIARAIVLEPEFLVADEPVSALDVSIQAQIVNLLADLQDELGLSLLFVSHDLAVVRHVAHRVAVMYLGKLVEVGQRDEVLTMPRHPYTRALLAAVLTPDPAVERTRKMATLKGEVPSPISPPSGCRFRTRCPLAMPICADIEPPLRQGADGRLVACHLVDNDRD